MQVHSIAKYSHPLRAARPIDMIHQDVVPE